MPGESVVKMFADYGGFIGLLIGTIVMGMGTAIVFLWRHIVTLNKELRKKESEHNAQIQAVQDKRVEEAKEVRKELMGLAEDFNKVTHELGSTITALKDAVLLRDRDR